MKRFRLLFLLTALIFTVSPIHFSTLALASEAIPQQGMREVKGTVRDDLLGETLVGVHILIKGTKTGVFTDIDGNFSIKVPSDKEVYLVFTYVGMKTQEVLVGKSDQLNVIMISDNTIDAVVVQGAYGTAQKRSDLVGSVFQVGAKQLETLPATRIDNLLGGLVPGLSIDPNTDSATGSVRTRYNTRVRGNASLSASNEPLWIVDGTPMYTGNSTNTMPGMSWTVSPLSFINPSDIESITVLKDASATSIYGANGANGVILVTTKSGAKGQHSVNVSLKYGISKIDESTRLKVLDAEQYMMMAKEAWVNGGQSLDLFPYQDNELNSYSTTDTRWHDIYYDLGHNMMVNFSIRSGSDKSKSYLSGSYYNEESTVSNNTQDRFSLRSNTEYSLAKNLVFKSILSMSYNENNIFTVGREYYETLPIFSPYMNDGYSFRLYNRIVDGLNPDGTLKWVDKKFFDNCVPDREANDNFQTTLKSNANLSLEYKPIDGMTITAQYGADFMNSREEIYYARTTLDGLSGTEPRGSSRRASANYFTWTNIERINYNKKFGKHTVGALAGMELNHKEYKTLYATGSGFSNDHIKEVGYSESDSRSGYSSSSTTRSLSFFAQASYSYDNRYYITLNARRDGNSAFGQYARWANFGSLGLSWNMHNENWFDSSFINLLKFKGSFGSNGNSRIDGSVSAGTYNYGDSYAYDGKIGAVMGTPANPGLSWETTYMSNIGVRVGLMDRIDFEVEYYFNYTVDLLSKIYTSRTIGDSRIYSNVGEVSNRGIEITINTQNISTQDFNWDTDFNISRNRNKIHKLYNGNSTGFGTSIWTEGADMDSYYLVRWAGVDPATGMPMWYDLNGNITFIYSDSNRVVDKSPNPFASGGMTNNFRWKNFSLRVQLNYTLGGYALSSNANYVMSDGYNIMDQNVSVNALDRWQKPGDLAVNPIFTTKSTKSSMYSTRHLYSKTHFKLQNISLSYRVPSKVCDKLKIRNANVSLICDNVYLWTPDQKRNLNSYKTYMSGYPMENIYSLSLDVTF